MVYTERLCPNRSSLSGFRFYNRVGILIGISRAEVYERVGEFVILVFIIVIINIIILIILV